PAPVPVPAPRASAAALVTSLASVYQQHDISRLRSLLHPDFVYTSAAPPGGPESLDAAAFLRIHETAFASTWVRPADLPVPLYTWVASGDASFMPTLSWSEDPDSYASTEHSAGLDRTLWRAEKARYVVGLTIEGEGDTAYLVRQTDEWVVAEDRSKDTGSAGKFLLYRWRSSPAQLAAAGDR